MNDNQFENYFRAIKEDNENLNKRVNDIQETVKSVSDSCTNILKILKTADFERKQLQSFTAEIDRRLRRIEQIHL